MNKKTDIIFLISVLLEAHSSTWRLTRKLRTIIYPSGFCRCIHSIFCNTIVVFSPHAIVTFYVLYDRHSCMIQDTRFVHLTAASKQLFSCQCARTDWNTCVLSLSATFQLPREWVRPHRESNFSVAATEKLPVRALSYKAVFSIRATK